jgi:hypothetical protein
VCGSTPRFRAVGVAVAFAAARAVASFNAWHRQHGSKSVVVMSGVSTMRSSPGVEMLARFLRAREGVTTMAAEIEYESGWLRRGGWCRWRLAVTLACVVAGVLWAAGPASAASRKWTVLNHTFHDLRLEEVTHVRGAPFGFEGRPEKGSFLDAARPDVLSKPERPTQQHFELKWGPDYQAVLSTGSIPRTCWCSSGSRTRWTSPIPAASLATSPT